MSNNDRGLDVAGVADRLQSRTLSGAADRSRRKVSSLMKDLGRERIDRPLLVALEGELSRRGIFFVPSLKEPSVGRDTWVTLTTVQPSGQLTVGREDHIVRIAEGLVGKPGPFLNFRKPRSRSKASQALLRNGSRVDLLLRSLRNGDADEWVVFEFKRARGGVAAVEQLVRYLRALEDEGVRPLRGIVVANEQPDVPLSSTPASECDWPVEWWVFEPRFTRVEDW